MLTLTTSGPDWGAKAPTAGEEDENKQRSTHNWDGFRITAKPLKKPHHNLKKTKQKSQIWKSEAWMNACLPMLGLTYAVRAPFGWLESVLLGFVGAYQWAVGLHEQLSGAVPDTVGDASRAVHSPDWPLLPGLLGSLHQLHSHAEFSKVLHPFSGWNALLPQPKMAIMADRCWRKAAEKTGHTLICWNARQCEKNTTNTQTVRSFPPRSLRVFLWLPWTSCN